ncbi:hypothetical protein BDA99DRAFT_556372 [Phascolomyces articulosus]|uniref:Galactose oxidase n=1 Tax=Phascolomyces articulosus TaxID=60185 RepID=A0AAD5KJA2_9FUNG|nr:hypothetical protein BDA99DRAFT_556372 [Phascolomyces articulosus]
MNPPRKDAATFMRNNTFYIWGGQGYYTNDDNFFDIVPYFNAIRLETSDTSNEEQKSLVFSFVNNSREYQNFAMGASAAVDPTNNDRVLFFGGYRNTQWEQYEDGPIYVEQFDFSNSQWTTVLSVAEDLNGTRIPAPRNRAWFTATAVSNNNNNNGNIYIAGGIIGDSNSTLDPVPIWMYSPTRQVFTPIIQQNESIIIADENETIFPFVLENNRILYLTTVSKNYVHILDTNTNQIITQPVQIQEGEFRDNITGLSLIQMDQYFAFTNPDNHREIIYYSDFYDTSKKNITSHLFSFDINNWSWVPRPLSELRGGSSSVIYQGFRPRYGASIGVFDDRYAIVAYGQDINYAFSDFRIIQKRTVDANTLEAILALGPNDVDYLKSVYRQKFDDFFLTDLLSKGAIAGIVISSVVAAILTCFFVWRYQRSIKRFITWSFGYLLWNPRTGEPRWTEYSHIVTKFILLSLFFAYLAYNLNQVINSPIVTLSFKPPAENGVMTPDTRLCFQGTLDINVTYSIKHEAGVSKNNVKSATRFPSSKFYPYSTYKVAHTNADCWYISREANSLKTGDVMAIEYTYTLDNVSTMHSVQIDVYPATAKKNPNEIIYFGNKSLELTPWEEEGIDDPQVLSFAQDTKNGMSNDNRYTLDLATSAIITYELQKHQYLANYGWNKVGFAPIYNDTAEVTTSLQTDVRGSGGVPIDPNAHSSLITLRPSGIVEVTLQDQQVNSLVSVLGSVGGLITLLVAFDNFFFGSRPRSPWGILHRVFPRNHKSSFENTLRDKFGFLNRPIPFVHPVHPRFVDEYDNLKRGDHGLLILPTTTPLSKNSQEHNKKIIEHENYGDQINNEKTVLHLDNVSYSYNGEESYIYGNSSSCTQIPTTALSPLPLSATTTPSTDLESRLRSLEETIQKNNQETENDRNYIKELERRQQLMELMLKSYYIDPEVFMGLNDSYINNDNEMIRQYMANSDSSSYDDTIMKDPSSPSHRPVPLRNRIKTTLGDRFRNYKKNKHQQLKERRDSRSSDQQSEDKNNIIMDTHHVDKDINSASNEITPFAKNN